MSDHARSVWRGVCVATVAISAGCSSGGDDGSTTTPVASTSPTVTTAPATTTGSTTPGGTAAVTTTGGATMPASTVPPATSPSTGEVSTDDAVAITAAFETFFGGSTSTLDEKVAVLADGETYRRMLADAGENEQFQQMSTAIDSIVAGTDASCAALAAPVGCAIVTHDLLIGGMPMAVQIESAATRTAEGDWLVAASAWCNVVAIGGESCDTAPDGTTP